MYCTFSCAQSSSANESLDRYFAGLPVRESYEMWVRYIIRHPHLGVDSINERGGYSSFKPGIKDHFPFPDSIQVKILFQKTLYYDSITNISIDSTNEISIEAVFPNNKLGRRGSAKVFNEVRKVLRRNYTSGVFENYSNGYGVLFSRGRNENFPDCSLSKGHSKELRFYFVMITYTSPRNNLLESN